MGKISSISPRVSVPGSMSSWRICFVYKSLALPQHRPLLRGTASRDPGYLLCPPPRPGSNADQPAMLTSPQGPAGGRRKARSASRLLAGQGKEVATGGSEFSEGLESRVQGVLPKPTAQSEMTMRMKMRMDNDRRMVTSASHSLSLSTQAGSL